MWPMMTHRDIVSLFKAYIESLHKPGHHHIKHGEIPETYSNTGELCSHQVFSTPHMGRQRKGHRTRATSDREL